METISGNFLTSSLTEEFLINPSYLQNDQVLQQVIFDQIDSFFFSIEPKCVNWLTILLQFSVPEGDLHCQCILSIFPASVHQFYANVLVFVNINQFLYINDQFALDYTHFGCQIVSVTILKTVAFIAGKKYPAIQNLFICFSIEIKL